MRPTWCSMLALLCFQTAWAEPTIPSFCGPLPQDWPPPGRRYIQMNGPELTGVALAAAGPAGRLIGAAEGRSLGGCAGAATPDGPDGRAGSPGLSVSHLRHGVRFADGKVACDGKIEGTEIMAGGRRGQDLAGGRLLGLTTDGRLVQLRIDDVLPEPEVARYRVSYQPGALTASGFQPSGAWTPLCAEGKAAITLSGRWDYGRGAVGASGKVDSDRRQVTFACPAGALAKCVRFGYRPWQARPANSDALHQACVRAIRADYCGDGCTATSTGRPVNLYDRAGIQKDEADWPFEASWTPKGALCVRPEQPRRSGDGRLADVLLRCPPARRAGDRLCRGDSAQKEALLSTEVRQ